MAKYLPHGTTFKINNIVVGGLISVGLPSRQRGEAETTDSASGGERTFIAGLRESGEVALTMRHDPDDNGQKQLQTNYAAVPGSAVVACVITLPDAATTVSGSQTWTFDGFVTQPPQGDLALTDDQAAEVTATIRIAGPVTIAP